MHHLFTRPRSLRPRATWWCRSRSWDYTGHPDHPLQADPPPVDPVKSVYGYQIQVTPRGLVARAVNSVGAHRSATARPGRTGQFEIRQLAGPTPPARWHLFMGGSASSGWTMNLGNLAPGATSGRLTRRRSTSTGSASSALDPRRVLP